MKCPRCNGTGAVRREFKIPVWDGAEKEIDVKFVPLNEEQNREKVADSAEEFHDFLTEKAHGVFYDTLKKCFKES